MKRNKLERRKEMQENRRLRNSGKEWKTKKNWERWNCKWKKQREKKMMSRQHYEKKKKSEMNR